MSLDEIVPAIFLILVLILILPRFLRSNSNTKTMFLKNLFFWSVIVGLVMIVSRSYLKMKKINIAVTGCMGRMGQQIIKSIKLDNNFKLVALTENRKINKKINGI